MPDYATCSCLLSILELIVDSVLARQGRSDRTKSAILKHVSFLRCINHSPEPCACVFTLFRASLEVIIPKCVALAIAKVNCELLDRCVVGFLSVTDGVVSGTNGSPRNRFIAMNRRESVDHTLTSLGVAQFDFLETSLYGRKQFPSIPRGVVLAQQAVNWLRL
jgi:hypothetical protein